jgi:hypothetical protein
LPQHATNGKVKYFAPNFFQLAGNGTSLTTKDRYRRAPHYRWKHENFKINLLFLKKTTVVPL